MIDDPERHLETLLHQRLFESASIFAAFAISGGSDGSKTRVLYGDALVGLGETKRAISHYSAALDRLKPNGDSALEQADIRFKIAQCHVTLKQSDKAIAVLEEIGAKNRSAGMSMALGKLYVRNGNGRVAINCFKDALRSPLCVEAIEPLLQLGVSSEDILATMPPCSQFPWISQYTLALALKMQHKDKDSLAVLRNLSALYPKNPYHLLPTAMTQIAAGDPDGALFTFETLRESEENWVTSLDAMASLLKFKSGLSDLNKLTHELLAIDIYRPEGWVSAGLYWELKKNRDKAIECVEKAVSLDQFHLESHILLGQLRLHSLKYDDALMAFKSARQILPDIRAYQGIVEAYIGLRRYKEGIATAKECLSLMPRNAKSFSLMGLALAQVPVGLDKAKSIFEKALAHDPANVETVLGYSDVLEAKLLRPLAITTLTNFLQRKSDANVFCKLATLLATEGQFMEALKHYNSALSLDETHDAARLGLEKLEKLIKGADAEGEEGADSRETSFDSFHR